MARIVLFLIVLATAWPLPGFAQAPDLRKPAGKEWLKLVLDSEWFGTPEGRFLRNKESHT